MNFIHQTTAKDYDYIIGGAGLAGLSLAYRMVSSGLLDQKRLLIIDADDKSSNDRTWSFWTADLAALTDFPLNTYWNKGIISAENFESLQTLSPYRYYSIEGLAYYKFIKSVLLQCTNIDWLLAKVIDENHEKKLIETTSGSVKYQEYFFKNYFSPDQLKQKTQGKDTNFLWQHFLGWRIKVAEELFDPSTITYMDMQVPQPTKGLAFMYILPYTKNEALLEYTFFSTELLEKAAYQEVLTKYIEQSVTTKTYAVLAEEFNKIPMTTLLQEKPHRGCIPIGTLAGVVKASTGYSFVRNQQHSKAIVEALLSGVRPKAFQDSKKHRFYDQVMIEVIGSGSEQGEKVFLALYRKNKLPLLLKFLDEETSLLEDLKIMNSVPKWTFIKAVFKQLFWSK